MAPSSLPACIQLPTSVFHAPRMRLMMRRRKSPATWRERINKAMRSLFALLISRFHRASTVKVSCVDCANRRGWNIQTKVMKQGMSPVLSLSNIVPVVVVSSSSDRRGRAAVRLMAQEQQRFPTGTHQIRSLHDLIHQDWHARSG